LEPEYVRVEGLRPLESIERDPAAWARFAERLNARTFLRSDGLANLVGVPHRLDGALLRECERLCTVVDQLYRGLAARHDGSAEADAEFLLNPMYRELLAAQRPRSPLPFTRLDCVLGEDGVLRFIELNTVGVCTIHLHVSTYLTHAMRRAGFGDDAERMLDLSNALGEALRACWRDERGGDDRPRTLGFLHLRNQARTTRLMMKELAARIGWPYEHGDVGTLELSADGVRMNGRPIELLWADFLPYLGYQYSRYTQTRFSSNFGDYTSAPDQTRRLVTSPQFLEAVRAGRVLNASPPQAYLLLSKHLLAHVHRDDCPLPAETRDWLRARTARTYALAERHGGALSREQAESARADLVLKPCQYGGAHGVVAGRELDDDAWKKRLDETWEDPSWVLQEYHAPCTTTLGRYVSIGLYSYGGRFGGMAMRTAPQLVISARRSALLPTTWGRT
jgi:hypothetical protein